MDISKTYSSRAPIHFANIFFIFFFTSAFIISCNNQKQEKVPDTIIPEDKLVLILVDLHQADAFLNFGASNTLVYEPKNYYNKVLENHSVTREKFNETIRYYSSNPAKLDTIYDHVLAKLSEMKAELIKSNYKNK
ncbi:MAG: DUF4296 domain-containing protein [Bacteroidia bacterium]|nr:DUF4296 domain-containing protein [Bacteroidia bacterium]